MENTADSIRKILDDQYGLTVTEAKKSSVGAGSDTWFVTCEDGKYVVKSCFGGLRKTEKH